MKKITDKLKDEIQNNHKLNDKKGICITCYDQSGKIIISKSIIKTDKTLEKVLDIIDKSFLEKNKNNIQTIRCDIIINENQIQELDQRDRKSNQGLVLINEKSQKSSVRIPNNKNNNTRSTQQVIIATLKKHEMETYTKAIILDLDTSTITI